MTEIPEHLRKRAEEARLKAGEVEHVDLTSGEEVAVPVELLTRLRSEYALITNLGQGHSKVIESLIGLVPVAQTVRSLLPEATWKVCVHVGDSQVFGVIDGADRTKIIDAITLALDKLSS